MSAIINYAVICSLGAEVKLNPMNLWCSGELKEILSNWMSLHKVETVGLFMPTVTPEYIIKSGKLDSDALPPKYVNEFHGLISQSEYILITKKKRDYELLNLDHENFKFDEHNIVKIKGADAVEQTLMKFFIQSVQFKNPYSNMLAYIQGNGRVDSNNNNNKKKKHHFYTPRNSCCFKHVVVQKKDTFLRFNIMFHDCCNQDTGYIDKIIEWYDAVVRRV